MAKTSALEGAQQALAPAGDIDAQIQALYADLDTLEQMVITLHSTLMNVSHRTKRLATLQAEIAC